MEVDEEDDADDEVVVLPGPPDKAASPPSAALPNVATAGRKPPPPTKQSATSKSTPGSTKDAGLSKSSQQPTTEPQAKPASEQGKVSFKPKIPTNLKKYKKPSVRADELLMRESDWKIGEVHPGALKDAALFCLNRHHFYNRPDKANLQKAAKVLGKFQLAFFRLWAITYENSKMVSFRT